MRRNDVGLTVLVTFVWGVCFVGIKEVLVAGPPLTMAGARFLLGGLLLVPFVARQGEAGLRRPTGQEVLTVGALQTTALYGFGFLGTQRATAGAAALLLNTNPMMVALLAVPFLGTRLRARAVTGAAVALAGVGVISVRSSLGSPTGITFLLVGALSWAGASVAIKRLGPAVDLLRLSCLQMIVGGAPLLLAGLTFEHTAPQWTGRAAFWFGFLVIPGTAVNFVVWFGLLQRYSAGAMTAWLFLIPLFAVISGAVLLDEPIGWRVAVGGILIVAGVALTQRESHSLERNRRQPTISRHRTQE